MSSETKSQVNVGNENTSSHGAETGATRPKKPVTAIVIGMAGSGKTTLMSKLGQYYADQEDEKEQEKGYFINLDPAVSQNEELPYFAHIDIRDTVKYKQVMKQFGLGPNGGIVTALNLFATKFDQVMGFCEKRAESGEITNIFIDTPGQIEVFTWSASGAIITEALATSFPTCILYIVDTPRNLSPITFMSNMMYACSIMFKTKLPFLLVFNKIDVASHQTLIDWMKDIDIFTEALKADDSYMSTLTRSMSLVLEEFYQTLSYVGVSAATGEGLTELFQAIENTREIYERTYVPLIAKRRAQRELLEKRERDEKLAHLAEQMKGATGLGMMTGKLPKGEQGGRQRGLDLSREPAARMPHGVDYGDTLAGSDEEEEEEDDNDDVGGDLIHLGGRPADEEGDEDKQAMNFGEMAKALDDIRNHGSE